MKKIRKLSKKFSAGLLGVTLLASGAAAQNLGDLPQPFVDDDGALSSSIVVGEDAKTSDVVSAIDIATTLGNDAYSNTTQTVEGSGETTSVNGVSKDVAIRGSLSSLSIDKSDYSNLVREVVTADDDTDHYIVENIDVTNTGVNTIAVNDTVETTVSSNTVSYSVSYSPSFDTDETITLLGEEYEVTGIDTGAGEVDLGSNQDQNGLEVGDSYTHGPYTVEVVDKDQSNSEIYVSISKDGDELKSTGLGTGNTTTVDNGKFEVTADSVFFGSQRDYIDVTSTYSEYTLVDGEDSEITPDYKTSLTFQSGKISKISLSNQVAAVDKNSDNLNEDEVEALEAGDSFQGPQGYFTLANTGLTNEATEEITFSEDYTVEYTDKEGFDQSLDIRNLVAGATSTLYNFNDGSTTSPTMFVDDGTNVGTYEDEDDVLKATREVGNSNLGSSTISDFSASEYYIASSSGFDGNQAIVDSGDNQLNPGEIEKGGSSGVLSAIGSSVKYVDTEADSQYTGDGSGNALEPIYSTSASTVDSTATRETSITVASTSSGGSTGDINRNLAGTGPAQVSSADFDTGFTLSSLTGSWHYVDADGSTTGSYSDGDELVYDTDSSSGISSGDIVFPEGNSPYVATSSGVNFDGTATLNNIDYDTAGGDDGSYGSGDSVILDFGTDQSSQGATFEAVDYDITSGSYGPANNFDGNLGSAQLSYWDVDESGGYSADKAIYVDHDGSGSIAATDVRATIFSTQTYSAGSGVTSTGADVGVSLNQLDEYYLENTGDTSLDVGSEAIIRSSDTNLDASGTDTVIVSGGFSNSQQSFTAGKTMYVGSNAYDGSQDILEVNQITTGNNQVALSGKTLHNFGTNIKHTSDDEDNAYVDGDAIVDDDGDSVYQAGTDTVITGSISGGILEDGSGDKDLYTDVSGHPVRVQFDDSADEVTVSYETFEQTVSVGDSSTTHDTGYGFSFTTSFDSTGGNGEEDFTLSSSDKTLDTQLGAEIRYDSGNSAIDVKEGSGSFDNLQVGYDGSNQVDSLDSNNGISSTTSETTTISNYGTQVDFEPEGSASFSYPENQRYASHAVGEVSTSQSGDSSYNLIEPQGTSEVGVLDSEASTSQDLILVGGPDVNDLTEDLAEQGDSWTGDEYTEGEGLLQMVSDAFTDGYDALVVAGQTAEDTTAAGNFLADYDENLEDLEGKSQAVIDSETGELVEE